MATEHGPDPGDHPVRDPVRGGPRHRSVGDTFAAAFGVALVAAGARLPVALFLGLVFDRRRSLWTTIGLHATFNAILLVIAERALSA